MIHVYQFVVHPVLLLFCESLKTLGLLGSGSSLFCSALCSAFRFDFGVFGGLGSFLSGAGVGGKIIEMLTKSFV